MLDSDLLGPDTRHDPATDSELGALAGLPPRAAAAALGRLAGLSAAAAAHHAARGDAFSYAGTLLVACRANDPLDGPTTTVHFVDPTVLEHDTAGLLAALHSRLPAAGLVIRAPAPLDDSRRPALPLGAHIMEREPASYAGSLSTGYIVEPAATVEDIEFARALLHRSLSSDPARTRARIGRYLTEAVGLGDPARSTTLIARRHGERVGQLTWQLCVDPFDRERRADIVDVSADVSGDDSAYAEDVVMALMAAMEGRAARVPGVRLRLAVGPADQDRLLQLCRRGWSLATSCWTTRPWDRAGRPLAIVP